MKPHFIDFDSISDRICWYGNFILSFTTKLSKKDKDGNRVHYHKEYEYNSQYLDTQKAYSIKRDYDYFFQIETPKYSPLIEYVFIQIRIENMIMLKSIMQKVVSLIYSDIWAVKDNKLIIKGSHKPIELAGLPMGKWLKFAPIVYIYPDNSYSKGVRITLSDESIFVDLSIDQFMGLVYIFDTFNMPLTAATMVNYLNWDEYGTSLVSFIDSNKQDMKDIERSKLEGIGSNMKRRTIPNGNKSYFDKMDEL